MRHQRRRPKIAGKVIVFLIAICIVSILTQVFWPGKKFMVFTKVGGVNVTGLTYEEARVRMEEIFADHILRVETTDGDLITNIDIPLEQIAIEAMMNDELDYPLWQRLIPFSSFVRIFYSNWIGAEVHLDVDEIMSSVETAPVDAHISSVDGVLTISQAKNGFTLDREYLARRLSRLRLSSSGTTTLRIRAELLPFEVDDDAIVVQAERAPATYSNLLATFRGTEFSLAAVGLDGLWDVSIDQNKTWTAASTYKLYVAYFILKKVDDGELTWDGVKSCLERMIVNSDNACPESWLVRYGHANINTALHQDIPELTQTKIAYSDMRTSARDLCLFLRKLYNFELLSKDSTNRLLDVMKRQTYRQGIPAGVAGNVVADKVGFMWGLLHDAGIVFSADGDYVLAILTDGSSWGNIAALAKIINNFNGD